MTIKRENLVTTRFARNKMARFEIRQFRIVGALLLIVLTSGCASWWSAVPLAKSDIALKPEPIPGFQINSIEAYRMPEGLFIKGIVKRVHENLVRPNSPMTEVSLSREILLRI